MRLEVNFFLALFISFSAKFELCCARRFGGGSIYSKTPSRTSGGISKTSSTRTYTRPTLGRNFGGFSGRASSSSTGFGLGLGSGLTIGYGVGMLSRPGGYGTPGYGYQYYQSSRTPLKKDEKLQCVVANYTYFAKVGSLDDDVTVIESSQECSPGQNICYGRLTVTTAKLTLENEDSVDGLVVQVEKGCDTSTNYTGNNKDSLGTFDQNRKCWNTDVKTVTLKSTSDTVYDYEDSDNLLKTFSVDQFADEEVYTALELGSNVKHIQEMKQQTEICVCDTMLCNSSMGLKLCSLTNYLFIITLLSKLLLP